MADDAVSTKGLLGLSAGPVNLTFSGRKGPKVVPDAVYFMLEPSWIYSVRNRVKRMAELVRT
jgi:hypothetical protein